MKEHFVQSGLAGLVAAVVMLGVAAPVAAGQPGDLDPAFGDHGRLSPIPGTSGIARSVALLDAGGLVVGGGIFYRRQTSGWENPRPTCQRTIGNFATRVGQGGTVDGALESAELAEVETFGLARQADGGIVGVGRELDGLSTSCFFPRTLVAFRFNVDGSLDAGFGDSGVFRLSLENGSWASAVVAEPGGRIVVAGAVLVSVGDTTVSKLLVLRLLADGSLDPDFGEQGVFIGPETGFLDTVRLLRADTGQLRVAAAGPRSCIVAGVTADGRPDASYGNAGVLDVFSHALKPLRCGSANLSPDGALLLAGSEILAEDDPDSQQHGFALRLLPDGTRDSGFVPDAAIAETFNDVTSIASTPDGKVLVAGWGGDRGSILRMLSSGSLDAAFGDGGRTWIDLLSDYGATPFVLDMAVRQDGSVIAVGGSGEPMAVRLLGDAGGPSAGVLSILGNFPEVPESDGRVVLRVRRTGGRDGAVSVAYRTVANGDAIAGQDFTPASGTLTWPDGDSSEREVSVEIAEDAAPPGATPERYEAFDVVLEEPQGGAGLGSRRGTVLIQPDGAPGGQIEFGLTQQETWEGSQNVFWLERRYFFAGRVCATVTPTAGTADAGADFAADAATVCWEDQDTESKAVEIAVVDDGDVEDAENFTLEISNPTGGAILGEQVAATVTLYDDDEVIVTPPPPPPPVDPRSGGGGSTGLFELLGLLGLWVIRAGVRGPSLNTILRRIS